jgi:hypothetical protein
MESVTYKFHGHPLRGALLHHSFIEYAKSRTWARGRYWGQQASRDQSHGRLTRCGQSGPLKKHVGGNRFTTDADVKQAVTSLLHITDTDFFYIRIQVLVPLWDRP